MSTWCFFFSFSWNELKLNKLFWILNTLLLTICFHFSSQLKKWEKRSYWFLNYQDFLLKPISGKFLFWYCVNESVLLLYINNLCSKAKKNCLVRILVQKTNCWDNVFKFNPPFDEKFFNVCFELQSNKACTLSKTCLYFCRFHC